MAKQDTTKAIAADKAAAPKVTGPTSGVMAVGKAGRAAREAAANAAVSTTTPGTWRDPNFKPAEGDQSIDARMARLTREIRG